MKEYKVELDIHGLKFQYPVRLQFSQVEEAVPTLYHVENFLLYVI